MKKTPRQVRLETLARMAFPGQSLEVIAPDEGAVHVWDEHGHGLLHVEHPLADEVLGVLAGAPGAMGVGVAIDATEKLLRMHAIDWVGLEDTHVLLRAHDANSTANGANLRDALGNLSRRSSTPPHLAAGPIESGDAATFLQLSPKALAAKGTKEP